MWRNNLSVIGNDKKGEPKSCGKWNPLKLSPLRKLHIKCFIYMYHNCSMLDWISSLPWKSLQVFQNSILDSWNYNYDSWKSKLKFQTYKQWGLSFESRMSTFEHYFTCTTLKLVHTVIMLSNGLKVPVFIHSIIQSTYCIHISDFLHLPWPESG